MKIDWYRAFFEPISNRDPNTVHHPCDLCGKVERIEVFFGAKSSLASGKHSLIACKSCLLHAVETIDTAWLDPTLDKRNRTSSYQK